MNESELASRLKVDRRTVVSWLDILEDANKSLEPIPEEFETIEAAADFWDTDSLADYWDETEAVQFDVDLQRSVFLVPLEHSLARRLADVARRQGLSTETLVNLWVSDRLRQVTG